MADVPIKLLLLGNGSVGKTSLIARFIENGFVRVYKQTIGVDFFEKRLDFARHQQRLLLQLWDIGGQNLNSKMLDKYLFNAHVVLLCYDVTDAQSFADVQDWWELVQAHQQQPGTASTVIAGLVSVSAPAPGAPGAPGTTTPQVHLLGNKIDLVDRRVVTAQQHESFIRTHKLHGGFFVSAQNGDNVVKTVYRVAAAAVNLPLNETDLAFLDHVVRATIPAAKDAHETRTAFADEIEAQDLADEQKKQSHRTLLAPGCQCGVM